MRVPPNAYNYTDKQIEDFISEVKVLQIDIVTATEQYIQIKAKHDQIKPEFIKDLDNWLLANHMPPEEWRTYGQKTRRAEYNGLFDTYKDITLQYTRARQTMMRMHRRIQYINSVLDVCKLRRKEIPIQQQY